MFKSMTDEHKKTLAQLIAIVLASFLLAFFTKDRAKSIWIILVFLILYLLAAWEVLKEAFEGLRRGQALDENFLMTIATVTAFLIGDYLEAIAVMVFYGFGELFEEIATHSSN